MKVTFERDLPAWTRIFGLSWMGPCIIEGVRYTGRMVSRHLIWIVIHIEGQ